EYRLRRCDGVYRWVLARGTPRFTPAGEFAGFVGLCMDVTDRKEATERVRESEARFRTLAETFPQLAWTIDPSGRCDYLSRQWGDYTGIPTREHLGTGWLATAHPDDRDRVTRRWAESAAAAADFDMEFR